MRMALIDSFKFTSVPRSFWFDDFVLALFSLSENAIAR